MPADDLAPTRRTNLSSRCVPVCLCFKKSPIHPPTHPSTHPPIIRHVPLQTRVGRNIASGTRCPSRVQWRDGYQEWEEDLVVWSSKASAIRGRTGGGGGGWRGGGKKGKQELAWTRLPLVFLCSGGWKDGYQRIMYKWRRRTAKEEKGGERAGEKKAKARRTCCFGGEESGVFLSLPSLMPYTTLQKKDQAHHPLASSAHHIFGPMAGGTLPVSPFCSFYTHLPK